MKQEEFEALAIKAIEACQAIVHGQRVHLACTQCIASALEDIELATREAAARIAEGMVEISGDTLDTGSMWRNSQSVAIAKAIRAAVPRTP